MNDPIIENLLGEMDRKVETKEFQDYLANVVDWETIFHTGHHNSNMNDNGDLFDKGAFHEEALEIASNGHIQRTEKTENGYDNYTTPLSPYPRYKIELKSRKSESDYRPKKGGLSKNVDRIIKNLQGSGKEELSKSADFYIFINTHQAFLLDYETVKKHSCRSGTDGKGSTWVAHIPREVLLLHVIATTQVERSSIVPASEYAKNKKRLRQEEIMLRREEMNNLLNKMSE